MSHYDKLDYLITSTIKSGRNSFTLVFNSQLVREEALRLTGFMGRDADRILGGRLQALRKRCVILHSKGRGWYVVQAGR